jgi:hypothetical protein
MRTNKTAVTSSLMRCTESAPVLAADLVRLEKLHDDEADGLVIRIGHGAYVARHDQTPVVGLAGATYAPRPPGSTGGHLLRQRSMVLGQGQGQQDHGPPSGSLVLLEWCKAHGSRVRKRKTVSRPIADGGVLVKVAATHSKKGRAIRMPATGTECIRRPTHRLHDGHSSA